MTGSQTLTITVASVPDRENLVAEIWLGSHQVAEVHAEDGEVMAQVYSPPGLAWDVPVDALLSALGKARDEVVRSMGPGTGEHPS